MARQKNDTFLKYSAAFLLRNRLKRYGFKMYDQNGQESIYSPYSILGIGMKELEIKKDSQNIISGWVQLEVQLSDVRIILLICRLLQIVKLSL